MGGPAGRVVLGTRAPVLRPYARQGEGHKLRHPNLAPAGATVAALERWTPGQVFHAVDDDPAPVRD